MDKLDYLTKYLLKENNEEMPTQNIDKKALLRSLCNIRDAKHIGIDSTHWRYDPIFIGMRFDVKKHVGEFKKMASSLKGYTHDCTISFLDLYEKVKRNAPNIHPPTKEESIELAKEFSKIGKEEPGDKITDAKQKSWIISKSKQISFI